MKKHLLFILLLFACATHAFAQSAVRAESFFQDGAYADALPIYEALHQRDARNVLYTYRLARCEQETGRSEEAIRHFIEAGNKYALRDFYLAELYFSTYRFDEAQESYADYLDAINEDHEKYTYVVERMRQAERALRYLHKMECVFFTDSISFPIREIGNYLPKLNADAGSIGGAVGLFTYTNQRADRRYMTVRDEDGNTLICKQERLLDLWGPIDTLPALVNHSEEQNYPFLLSDGMTLYYAAKSATGLGGWDIYRTKYNPSSDSYSRPELVNMPLNSTDNDFLYIEDETAGKGYFLTDRKHIPGHLTLFTFLLTEHKAYEAPMDDKRAAARLEQFITVPETEEDTPQYTPLPERVQPDFTLVINDSVVYHSLAELPSDDSRTQAEAYLDILRQIDEEQADIEARRLAYKQAESAEEKQVLRPLILALEKDIIRLKKESATMLKELRHSLQK